MLTHERLCEILSYDPEAGEFRWLISLSNRAPIGSIAGSVKSPGYRNIRIDGRGYYAHRLAWFWMMKSWPESDTDHINLDKDDNRWTNLREATRSENKRNTQKPRTNTSGFKGVTWYAPLNKWKAQIKVIGKNRHLGYFSDINAAAAAYAAASERLHGEFGRAA